MVRALGSLRHHTDYVMCLGHASGPRLLASAGLDSHVAVSDMEALTAVLGLSVEEGGRHTARPGDHRSGPGGGRHMDLLVKTAPDGSVGRCCRLGNRGEKRPRVDRSMTRRTV